MFEWSVPGAVFRLPPVAYARSVPMRGIGEPDGSNGHGRNISVQKLFKVFSAERTDSEQRVRRLFNN
ncbi:hypothetical protein SAMN05216466_101335 [Paraburkholderia phenazinium]|jgi:hypothetical protein|uniref:Uncharacterized protein n=1 Tax=Paraburkholderia phenazinium TaxID=60549 RepID=A0A1G7PJP5_9BURK|nr:hypothetical protein SAMN05216466_101335 [Paraburkholderia phenazinium]